MKLFVGLMIPTIASYVILFLRSFPTAAKPLGFVRPPYSKLAQNRYSFKPPATSKCTSATPSWSSSNIGLSSSMGDISQITNQVIEEYELNDQFERWSFLQRLLDNELPLLDIENVILAVFNAYLSHGPSVGTHAKPDDDNNGLPSPVLDEGMRSSIEQLISNILSIDVTSDDNDDFESRFLHFFVQPPIDYELEVLMGTLIDSDDASADGETEIHPQALSLVNQIEQLLPDPTEDEDAHKSLWDLIIELYGREAVRVREEAIQRHGVNRSKENMSWKTLCCIGRVLIHYDFLTKGILSFKE
jgi:hypothetical protein